MYHTTGFTREQVTELCAVIHRRAEDSGEKPWPPILGLFKCVVVALSYMRRNRVQEELAEAHGVSQPTISRAVTAMTPFLGEVLDEYVPTADELDEEEQYIADGSLLPCWSWASHPELYSGKHKTTGMNAIFACTISGRLAWISDPVPGSRHDVYCLDESGVLLDTDPRNWLGDKGFAGRKMLTPIKKPAHRDLLEWEKDFNTAINKIRYKIERTIANFKTWRIMHTDYRRPLETFRQTISTVIALHFYKLACE
jgi:DDE superfamily endonuclease